MSQGTEQVEESSNLVDSILDHLENWYHVPVLGMLLGFMLWVRLQSYDRFTVGGEVFFSGNDAWYHLRQVQYTVNNWPATMPFDPWTYYPHGTSVGQFGTLYDQLIATAALVVGLGDPSQKTVALTLLVAPAVFGTLVAVPTYFVGKRLGGRLGGLFGVLILALLPGVFLRRGLVGFADHNVVEPFFQTFAVLAMMVAVTVAERERPVFEQLADRDFTGVRRPLGYSVLAGIATALYLWTWPPGVLLIGIFGVFFLLKLTADYVLGISPDHLAFVATVSMGVTGLLLLVPLGTISFSATKFSLLQPLMAFAIAAGVGFMTWLAREWDDRDLSPTLYPVAIFGILAIGILVVYVALPGLFNLIQTNLIRFVGFGTNAAQRTIGEAKPFLEDGSLASAVIPQYGLTFFTAIVGALVMIWRSWVADEHDAEKLLVLVWAAFITAAAFTQVRFNYYLAVPVAVLNAYLLGWILSLVGFDGSARDTVQNAEMYQVLAVIFVFMLVLPALVMPVQVGNTQTYNAVQMGNATSPGAVTQWDGTLEWMQTNTPQEGNYGGAGNSMAYYGTYTEGDGDYDYKKGTYGVMSWWDYGHWITVEGERIPNANPFQEGARPAANYLLAQNESEANQVLNRMGEPNEKTRYVMVDWKMVNTRGQQGNVKFSAPTVFNQNVSQSTFMDYIVFGQNQYIIQHKQPYYETMMVRLYRYHGSAVEPKPIVLDWEPRTQNGQRFKVAASAASQNSNDTTVKGFNTTQQAHEYVRKDGSSQIGGIGPYPSERVPALQHYRVVKVSQSQSTWVRSHYQVIMQRLGLLQGVSSPQSYFPTSPSWVKTFERVPGAEVRGTGPANTTITASVKMRTDAGTFTYTQQAKTGQDGTFTMTLPYSTTGYQKWGIDKGYTNVSARAVGPYEFRTPMKAGDNGFTFQNGTAHVSEGQVLGENDSPVTVSVNQQQTVPVGGANNSTNATNGSAAPGNQTGGNSTGGNESNSLPDPTSPATRAGLVGAYAAAMVVARRD